MNNPETRATLSIERIAKTNKCKNSEI